METKTITEAFELAFKMQQMGIAEIFFRYSGHTNQIDVTIYKDNWNRWQELKDFNYDINFSKMFYLDFSDENNIKRYNKLIEYLVKCVNEKTLIPPASFWENHKIQTL